MTLPVADLRATLLLLCCKSSPSKTPPKSPSIPPNGKNKAVPTMTPIKPYIRDFFEAPLYFAPTIPARVSISIESNTIIPRMPRPESVICVNPSIKAKRQVIKNMYHKAGKTGTKTRKMAGKSKMMEMIREIE